MALGVRVHPPIGRRGPNGFSGSTPALDSDPANGCCSRWLTTRLMGEDVSTADHRCSAIEGPPCVAARHSQVARDALSPGLKPVIHCRTARDRTGAFSALPLARRRSEEYPRA